MSGLTELFEVLDVDGSGQLITFFAGSWDGDETRLPLAEGVELRFFDPGHLGDLAIPPYIRAGIQRWLARQAANGTGYGSGHSGSPLPPRSSGAM